MVKFTGREIRDLIISMLVIAGAFAFILSGKNVGFTLFLLPYTLIAAGLGFLLHELAHKFVAIHYGFWAEYQVWPEGLILAIVVSAISNFVFAAPGAVYIHGQYISKEQNGKISISGPLTNIILALFFMALIPLLPENSLLWKFAGIGFLVNSFLALFNLIPFGIWDGAKIFRWNPVIWVVTAAIAGIMTYYSMFGGL
jgi:Zn-dependent protease